MLGGIFHNCRLKQLRAVERTKIGMQVNNKLEIVSVCIVLYICERSKLFNDEHINQNISNKETDKFEGNYQLKRKRKL